ncbi:hypothetical protein [Tropicimonas sediminicola]|uniref:Uncharacterized protein n=1 Tax=Tropicimonas sediminicola TaxID=1031541 RepID=A0A239MG51_9RHOB|nr:hypothetical protein [Tropicimonas sediminicola]SNT41153.1 hypothetical protein SAMN05421757_1189 [Tropicimonas sediminicola]
MHQIVKGSLRAGTMLVICLFGAATAQPASSECVITIPPEEVPGETIICGQLQVPENWDAPEARKIPLSYVVLKSQSLAPFRDPVV